MIANHSKIGLGVYSLPIASKIIGVSSQKLRRWTSCKDGIVQSRFRETDAISFLDMMELLFVKMFRDENVSMQTIKLAASKASEKFNTDYPFAVKRFDTDGKTIFATLLKSEDDGELVEDLRRGQLVFRSIIKPFFKRLEYGQSDAMRYWPLLKSGRVVLDPMRSLGQPIDSKTGIPTKAIFDAVQAGQSQKMVSKWFDIPVAAVRQAVKFEKSL